MCEFQPLLAYMKGSFKSKWKTRENWDLKVEPNYRQRLPNEIVLETDYEKPETNLEVATKTTEILEQKNISYQMWFSGNKSYHINILFDTDLTKNMIEQWVYKTFEKALADCFDDCNWNEKRLVGIEWQPHQKTGKLKSLIKEFDSTTQNVFPKEIKTKKKKYVLKTKDVSFRGKCLICELALVEKFPESSNRHQHIIPNFVAIMPTTCWQQCANTQGKNLVEFENWANIKPFFKCSQLQKYASKNGFIGVCDNCPYKKIRLTQEQWNLKKKMSAGWK